jgi:hypothetical protein
MQYASRTKLYTFLSAAIILLQSGCETTPASILGNIPRGFPEPARTLYPGQAYTDPKGRFFVKITDPIGLLPRRVPGGTILEGKSVERGDIAYAVLVYELPSEPSPADKEALVSAWEGFAQKEAMRVKEFDRRFSVFKGYPSMDIYYHTIRGNYWRPYLARFVRVYDRVYHLYYSRGDAWFTTPRDPEQPVEGALIIPAEEFFEGVTFVVLEHC